MRSLVGVRFGKQVVLRELGKDYVEIHCDCGTIKKSRKMYLLNGQSRSCGCGRRADQAPSIKVGDVFERLTVVQKLGPSGNKRDVLVRCACGTNKVVTETDLRRGSTRSCGCLRRELFAQKSRTHGQAGRNPTYLYRAWSSMWTRVGNPERYPSYAGRGITVTAEWKKFEPFRDYVEEHLGPRPEGFSLDRIDNDRGYEPGNIRWADARDQAWNRSTGVSGTKLTVNGETKFLSEWSQQFGVALGTIHARLRAGWDPEKAVSQPARTGELTIDGESRPLEEWVQNGVSAKVARRRQARGWSLETALKRPPKQDVVLTIRGEQKRLVDWAVEAGISPAKIHVRRRRGWSDEEAVFGK